jgi:hypothetical protein
VNAVTCAVPTVFLVYSSKAIGMCKFVYGKNDMILEMNELAKSGIREVWIKSVVDSLHQTKQYIENKSKELAYDSGLAIDDIRLFVFKENE